MSYAILENGSWRELVPGQPVTIDGVVYSYGTILNWSSQQRTAKGVKTVEEPGPVPEGKVAAGSLIADRDGNPVRAYDLRDMTAEEIAARDQARFMPLQPRQFWLVAMSLGVTEAAVDALIEQMPEAEREAARIEKQWAQSYERHHPLVVQISGAFGIDPAALDEEWLAAQTAQAA